MQIKLTWEEFQSYALAWLKDSKKYDVALTTPIEFTVSRHDGEHIPAEMPDYVYITLT